MGGMIGKVIGYCVLPDLRPFYSHDNGNAHPALHPRHSSGPTVVVY